MLVRSILTEIVRGKEGILGNKKWWTRGESSDWKVVGSGPEFSASWNWEDTEHKTLYLYDLQSTWFRPGNKGLAQ